MLAGALAITVPWLCKSEGTSLTAYQDVARVWTVCSGVAYVKPGTTYTQEQCTKINKDKDAAYLAAVANLVDADKLIGIPHPDLLLASYTHFAFNIGVAGFARSSTLRDQKAGNLSQSCKDMIKWDVLNGKHCIDPQGHVSVAASCKGLINRRHDEIARCQEALIP